MIFVTVGTHVLYYQCKKNENNVKKVVYENVIFYTIILDIFVLITQGKGLYIHQMIILSMQL